MVNGHVGSLIENGYVIVRKKNNINLKKRRIKFIHSKKRYHSILKKCLIPIDKLIICIKERNHHKGYSQKHIKKI